MTQTFASWKSLYLTAKLNPTDSSLTADRDIWIDAWCLFLKNDSQKEWISFTSVTASWSNYVYWGLTRWLSQTADPATAWTWLTWLANQECVLTAMHHQLFDKQQDNILPKAISFSGTTNSWLTVANLTTTQRLALTPANWMLVYDTTLWLFYQYTSSWWADVDTWTTTPNATTTVAWKVEIATTAQSKAGTDTGETWALLSALPSDIAANIQSWTFVYAVDAEANDTYVVTLIPALTAYTAWQRLTLKFTTANTGACTVNVNSLWAKAIKTRAWNDPQDWDIAAWSIRTLTYDWTNFVLDVNKATASEQWIVEMCTDAEALAWTDEERYINSKQAKDNYLNSRLISTQTWNVTISNSNVETTLYTATIPWNTLSTWNAVRMTISVSTSVLVSWTLSFKVYYWSDAVTLPATASVWSSTSGKIEAIVMWAWTTSSQEITWTYILFWNSVTNIWNWSIGGTQTSTWDLEFKVTATFSTANASNNITVTNCITEIIA